MKKLSILLSVMAMIATPDLALSYEVGKPSTGPSSRASSGGLGARPVQGGISSISRGTCEATDIGKRISLGFLNNIIVGNGKLEIKKLPNKKFTLDMPEYISACLDLEAKVVQAGSNFYIDIVSKKEIMRDEVEVKDGESWEDMPWELKWRRCVEKKGLVNDDGNWNYTQARNTNKLARGFRDIQTTSYREAIGDGAQSVNVYYISSNMTQMGKEDGKLKNETMVGAYPDGYDCVTFENLEKDKPYRLFTSERDEAYDRALQACEEENAQMILDELTKLKRSSAGNYNDLIGILEQAYEGIKGSRSEEIIEEMDKIKQYFRNNKNISEETAASKAQEYQALMREYNDLVIAPNTRKIRELMEEDAEGNYEAIKELGREMTAFSKSHNSKFGKMQEQLEEHGLTDEFRAIEGVRLAAETYGRVYDGKFDNKRGPQLDSIDEATDYIEGKLNYLDNEVLQRWEMAYEAKNGNRAVLRVQQRRLRERKERMDKRLSDFQRTEQRNNLRYCGNNGLGMMRNPVRCRSWQAGAERRYQRMLRARGRDLRGLRTAAGDLASFQQSYDDYLDAREKEREEYDPFGLYDGYSSIYDGYDIYGSADDYSSDNSWMYSMQTPGMSMQAGMMPMGSRNPAAFSPMVPGGQPQFAMPGASPFAGGNPYATPFQ